jgi:hypothetical protein
VAEHICEEVNERTEGIVRIPMIVVEREAHGKIAADIRALKS